MNRARHQTGRLLLVLLLPLAILLASGCRQGSDPASRPRMDRLDLMSEVDVVVYCSNTAALMAALEDAPLGRFWKSPEMEAFRDGRDLKAELREALVDEQDGPNGAKIRDIYLEELKMLDGEVIVGLDFSDDDGDPAVTIVAAIDEEEYRRSLEMDALLFELEDVETIKASEDFRGTPLYTYIRKEEEGDRFIYQAFHQGTLLVSENRGWLETALFRLMETPAREPASHPVLTLSAKARLMDQLQTLLAEKASQANAPVDPLTVVKSLGLDSLGDMAFTLAMKEDRAEIVFQVDRRGEWNRGLMVLIPREPAPRDFRLAYVPRNVASYQVTRLDLNAFWTQLPEMLRQISPEFQMQFNMGINAAGGMLNIDVNEDIFNNLDRLAFTFACLENDAQQVLYGIKVKNADAMERTLGKLFADHSPIVAQLGDLYRPTDIQGRLVHVIQIPMPAAGDGFPVSNEIGLTVVDRALMIGQGSLLVDYVQAAVNNQGMPEFYTQPAFQTMAAGVPAEACGYGMSDLGAYARYYVNQIRTALEASQEAGASPANADADGQDPADPLEEFLKGFDLDRLPPADVIASYLGTSEGYSVMDEAGFRSTMTIRYPER